MTPGAAAEGDLARGRQLTDELERTVHALESRLGRGLDVRRVRADLDHLRESLALLQELQEAADAGVQRAGSGAGRRSEPVVEIPDTPYDPTLWRDAGDEGIGSR
ncbi:hypothetical protein C7M71_019455 [Peterkaempfera bronchialis]|uniref:Uncharacterized protein n=2 Tax=Peterkaempfera bronchialis TaxID=2126346 RepID=A0A345T6B7_9ACTN|nr:hypothetical protein C7M71_019455 [Peterkaempfera bronchialis]